MYKVFLAILFITDSNGNNVNVSQKEIKKINFDTVVPQNTTEKN